MTQIYVGSSSIIYIPSSPRRRYNIKQYNLFPGIFIMSFPNIIILLLLSWCLRCRSILTRMLDTRKTFIKSYWDQLFSTLGTMNLFDTVNSWQVCHKWCVFDGTVGRLVVCPNACASPIVLAVRPLQMKEMPPAHYLWKNCYFSYLHLGQNSQQQ